MENFSSTRGKMISTLLVMGFVLTTVTVFAQPEWSVNPKDYKHSTTVNAVVIVGGAEMEDGMLGAFINGECRGVTFDSDDDNLYGYNIFSFKVYSNVKSGETVYFMFYGGDDDKDDDEVLYAITETGTFVSKGNIGYSWYPIKLQTYLDTEAPIVSSCPEDITTKNDTGICGAVVNYTEPVFQDNALGTGISGEMTAGFASGSEFPVGTTTVTYAYTDESGNGPATCSFDVTVKDMEAPVPDAVLLADSTAECEVTTLTTPTATDNCDGSVRGTHDATLPITTQGTTVVTWTFTDAAGNVSMQTQDVIIDDVAPPIPDVATLPVVPGDCAATIVTIPTATDNCAGTITGTTTDPLTYTEQGTYTVTWTYDDGNGNDTTQTQTVIIDDIAPPTIADCPVNIEVDNDAGECGAVVPYTVPLFADNCDGEGRAGIRTDGLVSGATFPVGTTTVTYEYTDDAGNGPVACTFTVTVNDSEAPTISAPRDVIVNTDSGLCETDALNVALGRPVLGDNCGVQSVTNNAPGVFPSGKTNVTWTVTDIHGLTSQATQVVTVVSDEDPMVIDCPVNIEVDNDAGECGAVVTYDVPLFANNCDTTGRAGFLTEGMASGAVFPVGTTTVTFTYTDAAGNGPATCSFTVTVNDKEDPIVSTCPADIEVDSEAGLPGMVITYSQPTFQDNCDGEGLTGILTDGLASGSTFPVGTTTVTYQYTDAASNTPAICTFDVTVNYINHAPTVATPLPDLYKDEGFVTHSIDLGGTFSDPEEDALTYTASSSDPDVVSVEVVSTTVVVTEEGIGASTITVTVTDEGGLTASTDFVFTVRNVNDAPVVVNAIPDQELADNIGAVTFDLDTVFFDKDLETLNYEVELSNPAIVSYILTGAEFTLNALEVGSVEVTVRANDAALSVVDIFTVTVVEEVLLIVKHEGRRMQHQDHVVVCNDAGSELVEVVSRVNWNLRKVGAIDWLVVNIEQDSLINIAFSQNFTGTDRVGEIEVYDAQGHTFIFYVKQKESCYPVGIETAFLHGMWMYPNPVEQVLYITHEQELLSDVRLEIIDGNGKILYQREIRSSVVGRAIEVDMHGYEEGVYYIRLSAEEQFFMRKIIKL